MGKLPLWSITTEGKQYMPGMVGLNNKKANSYINVVVQILARVRPIRDFFLIDNCHTKSCSLLFKRTSELLKKIWYTKQFKGQVSPHQFLRAVISESKDKFSIVNEEDPVSFFVWLLNSLQNVTIDGVSVLRHTITEAFSGELEIQKESSCSGVELQHSSCRSTSVTPFLILPLDLPSPPLFKDAYDKMQIPQVPLFKLLKKYSQETVHGNIKEGFRRYRLKRLPNFLALSIERFSKNNFFWEKNPSIVNFPIKNLDLKDAISMPDLETSTKYDLIASVSHEGKVEGGGYKIYVNRPAEDLWYEIRDLTVMEVLPQMVCLSEAYLQIYELRKTVS